MGGPLKDSKLQKFIPGPGNYDSNKSMLDQRAPSLKPRLPDNSLKHLTKVIKIRDRFLDLGLINTRRSEEICIMQLPNSATIQTTE